MDKPKRIDVKPEELEAFLKRVETRQLRDEDYALIRVLVDTFNSLQRAVQEKGASVKRLLRWIFGSSTESSKNILKKSDDDDDDEKPDTNSAGGNLKSSSTKPAGGHGRHSSAAYTGANRHPVSHQQLVIGSHCPRCPKGKLYHRSQPVTIIHFTAQPPIQADIYELEQLRCSSCGAVFTATPPPEAGTEKYDVSVGSMIAILKYGSGMPFYRIAKLQWSLGVPLPASTQWDVVEMMANACDPVYRELIRQAAQGAVIHLDDTTMKILALMKERRDAARAGNVGRTGMFTTGMLSFGSGHQIALFFTGANHAGENMHELLAARVKALGPPIQMCDALSRNLAREFEVILANCLSHARRNFVEIIADFPEACRHVIETLAEVYKHDETAKQRRLSAAERLQFHQQQSAPLMTGREGLAGPAVRRKKGGAQLKPGKSHRLCAQSLGTADAFSQGSRGTAG